LAFLYVDMTDIYQKDGKTGDLHWHLHLGDYSKLFGDSFMNRTSLVQTQFLSVQDVAAIVAQVGTADTLRRMADYIEADYKRWQDFDKCARVAAHSPEGVIELMPIADAKTYTFKYVNGHPKNTQVGLPTVMAFGVLADVDTGTPELLSELTLTTALRTAAMSAVAARTLARPDSKSMALIGNGAQSEFQALAFHHLLGIEEIRLYDTDPAATQKLLNNLKHTKLRLTVCDSIAQAVRGADIVTTVTADKTNATILTPDLLRASDVFVQYEPQTRIEGDLQHLPANFAVTELWQVLLRQASGRTSQSQITLFDSVGFALEYYSALRYLRDVAAELGLGQRVSLIPNLADPKDLFSLIRPAPVALALAA
jgi:ornithine cyclodeaminase